MKNDLNLQVNSESGVVTILEGKTLELKEPKIITIGGILETPFAWLEKRTTEIAGMEAHVLVDRDNMAIKLITEEKNHYATTISGKLIVHPDFLKFNINSGKYLTTFAMAELFKMNRSCFEVQASAMTIVDSLMNFKAKVDKEIENSQTQGGDRRLLMAQKVKSNIPEKFNLNIPIFKGAAKQVFEIEIYVNPEDLSCTLISPMANDLISQIRDVAIDDVLVKIRNLRADIAILEQ